MRRTILLVMLLLAFLALFSEVRRSGPAVVPKSEQNVRQLRKDFGMTDAEARSMMDYSQRKVQEINDNALQNSRRDD